MRRESPYPMVPVEVALETILDYTPVVEVVEAPLQEAAGRVLAESVVAEEDHPPGPRSTVDGFAVIAADSSVKRRVLAEITAGKPVEVSVEPGTAAPIMTGGVLPPGADAVVMVEDVEVQDGLAEIDGEVRPGQCVQPVGQDISRGQRLLDEGTLLGPAEIGLLATIGRTNVRVRRRPKVAILATGDELVEPWETPRPGWIRDSNRYTLIEAAREAGADVVWHNKAVDEEPELEEALTEALSRADVVLTTGGVSMGTRDLIKPILARRGQVHFGRVNFKPGKPLTFATVGERLVFGLPGFPVSSLVTFEVFVRPSLLKLQGRRQWLRPEVQVELEHDLQPDATRPEFQRAEVRWKDGRLVATTTGAQTSSRLLSMLGSNALLHIAPGRETLPAGTCVRALLTGSL